MEMKSILSDAQGFTNLEEDWYKMYCYEFEGDPGEDGVSLTESGAYMWTGNFEVNEGPFAGKQVRFHNVMLSGVSKKGKDINTGMPGGLCEYINGGLIPWECLGCGHKNRGGLLHGATAESSGLDKSKFYCPSCKTDADMKYDTKDFQGPSVMAYVEVGEDLKGRPRNQISRFLPIGHPDASRPPVRNTRKRH